MKKLVLFLLLILVLLPSCVTMNAKDWRATSDYYHGFLVELKAAVPAVEAVAGIVSPGSIPAIMALNPAIAQAEAVLDLFDKQIAAKADRVELEAHAQAVFGAVGVVGAAVGGVKP